MKFWESFDLLVKASEIFIDRPKETAHPRFSNIIYPLDYGYLKGTTAGDGDGIDIWIGSLSTNQVTGIVVTVDLYKKDAEQKILFNCTDKEMETIASFHNVKKQSSKLIVRNLQSD